MDDIVERYEIEVKRGMMQVAILCLLEQESYGYDIIKSLKEDGLGVEDGTLTRSWAVEGEKLLSSKWEMNGPRPRKYYVITAYGKEIRAKLLASLKNYTAAIERMEEKAKGGH